MVLKIWEEKGIEAAMQFYYYGQLNTKPSRISEEDFGIDNTDWSDFQETDSK